MLKIHHIGIVVKSIEGYLKTSQYVRSSDVVYDSAQHSHICMLEAGRNEPPIELIQPIDEGSTTYQYLRKHGNGIHHLCYQAESYEKLEEYMSQHKLKRISGPVGAKVFDDRLIVFAYSRSHGIVEFLLMGEGSV